MSSLPQETIVAGQLLLPLASSPAQSVTTEQFSAFFYPDDLAADQISIEFSEPTLDTIDLLVTKLVNPTIDPCFAPPTEHEPNFEPADRAFGKYSLPTHNELGLTDQEVCEFWRLARRPAVEVQDPEELLSPSFAQKFEKEVGLAMAQGISEEDWREMDERSEKKKSISMLLASASTQIIALPKECVLETKDLNNLEALLKLSKHLRKFSHRKDTSKRTSRYIDGTVLRNLWHYRRLLVEQQMGVSTEMVTNEVAQSIEGEVYDSDATTAETEVDLRERLHMRVQSKLDELVRADQETTARRQKVSSAEGSLIEGVAAVIIDLDSERSSKVPSVFSTEAIEVDEEGKDSSPEDVEMEDKAKEDWAEDHQSG